MNAAAAARRTGTGTGSSDPPRRSRWIPWLFVGGFGIIVAVNGTMITLAVGSFTGLTTTEPYTRGLRYNEQLRQAEAQARLGWRLAARFERVASQRGTLVLAASDRNGMPLAGAAVTATFSRPVERGHDFTVTMEPRGGGRYAAAMDFPLPGAWDVRYRIARDDAAIEARERLEIR